MKNAKSVFGILQTRVQAETVTDALRLAGFRHSDISVLMPKMGDSENFAHKKNTKAPEGATTGATTGAVVGTGLGWLVGIGALAVPGVGPLVAAGPIVSAMAGAGVGGAVGGITGALVGMGIPEYEAKRYEGYVKDGGILISVHTDDSEWKKKAKNLLEIHKAEDISSADEIKARKPPEQVHKNPTARARY